MAGMNDPGQMGPPPVPPSWPPATPPAAPPPSPPGIPPAGTPPPLQGWTPPATPAGGTPPPKGGGGKLWLVVGAVIVVLLIAGGAVYFLTKSSKPTVASNIPGGSTATPSVAPSVAPTATPTESTPSTPTPGLTGDAAGGFGDTTVNPDSTFICGASASTSGTVIAYTTVAGSDSDTGNALCSALEADGSWTDIKTIAASSYEAVPECFLTTPDGSVTARIYTAVPGGTDAATTTLCNTVFESAGVTPSPGPSPTPAS